MELVEAVVVDPPGSVMVTVELAANPVPDIVIVEPAEPEEGDTDSEMDWMNDINDLCILAKNNPWMITGKLQSLQCERCEGIISQIKTILEKLPNPPI